MITDSTTAVPTEVSQNIDTLHQKVEGLQRELAQALEVWQGTLNDEKNKFSELLEHKDLAWQEQENQWARQSQAYEERLAEIKTDFEARLKLTEQNAVRALAELDDAWQRDKLEWGPAARSEWPAQRRELEARAQALEQRIQELENRPEVTTGPTADTVKALESQLVDFQQTVSLLHHEAAHSDDLVNACVQAIDYQISVLHDLVYQTAPPDLGQS